MKISYKKALPILECFLCITLLSLLPDFVLAADITSVLDKTVTFLQGGVARSVGLIAIISSGYLCIVSQKLPMTRFGMILGGLGLIFGASSMYSTFV